MKWQRLAWIVGALGLLATWPSGQSGLIPTTVESLDGNQRDLAGPADVTALVPDLERVYAAQGRRMALYQVSTRDRQFFGEPTFSTELSAVGIDEARNLMFVLTGATNTGEPDPITGQPIVIKGKLQVYNITTASQPALIQTFDNLSAHDIRVIPEDEKLLLIHQHDEPPPGNPVPRVTVYDYSGASTLTEIQHVDLPALMAETCSEDPEPRDVISLSSAVVQVDDSGATPIRRVFLRAGLKHNRVDVAIQKGATGIVAIQLDPLYTAAPTFYSHVFDAYPCPVPHTIPGDPTSPVVPPREYALRDLDLVKLGSNWFLCAVGDKEHGAKVFLLNNFNVVGFDRYEEETVFGSAVHDDLVAVEVVGSNLAILSRHYAIAAQVQNLGNSVASATTFGEGPQRDTLLMKEGSTSAPETKFWSMGSGTGSDYRFKIQDVSALLPGAPVLEEAYYGPGGTDAAVYIPEYDSVYATSFHGVTRHDVGLPPDAIPDYDSYSPALDGAEPLPVEHMIAVKRAPPWDVYTWQLFANAAVGGFLQWGIHPVTHQPHLLAFEDGVAAGAWPNWSFFTPGAGPAPYGQDQEYGIDPHSPPRASRPTCA